MWYHYSHLNDEESDDLDPATVFPATGMLVGLRVLADGDSKDPAGIRDAAVGSSDSSAREAGKRLFLRLRQHAARR